MLKLNNKGVVHFLLPVILAVIGFLVYFLATSTLPFKDKLFSLLYPKPSSYAVTPAVRGEAGDLWADIVLGQVDFAQGVPGEITNFKVAAPGGIVVDRSSSPSKVYVFDGLNSRILGYRSLGVCSDNSTKECTTDSDCGTSTCNIQVGGETGTKKADIVLGQPSFNTSACNGDGTFQSYPIPAQASNQSLCFMLPDEPSPYEDGSSGSMAVDQQGNLYVPDFLNHRVLKYNSPFTSDAIADDVWGQDDFFGNKCNKGQSNPTASSFCFFDTTKKPHLAGVDIDSQGNLWVADAANHRVLRFPKLGNEQIAKQADLVLGQNSFNTKNYGNTLSTLYFPSALRVSPSGTVYVADTWNNRIIQFDNPTQNGADGSIFVYGEPAPPTEPYRAPTTLLWFPLGIEFDITPINTLSGDVWVNDTNHNRLILFDSSGNPKKVLGKDTIDRDKGCGLNGSVCQSPDGGRTCNFCGSSGSMGITSDGDVMLTASFNFQNVYFYKHPIPTPQPEIVYGPANLLFYPPEGRNYFSDKGLISPRGLAITNNQFIISDAYRIMFWNTPNGIASLDNYKAADGVVGVPDFKTFASTGFGRITASNNYLWVNRGYQIERYNLPLVNGQSASKIINLKNEFKLLGQTTSIGVDASAGSFFADPQERYLWLALRNNKRVIRVRIPQTESEEWIIDVIIGGSNIPPEDLTWHRPCPNPDEPCAPGSVAEDKRGHLYISDYDIENEGTGRLARFDQSQLPLNNSSLIILNFTQASQIFNLVYGWQMAFNSQNQMVIGGAAFTQKQGILEFSPDVLSQIPPWFSQSEVFSDRFAQAYTSIFDSQDNLIVADMNHGRILIYKTPIFTPLPSSSPYIYPTGIGCIESPAYNEDSCTDYRLITSTNFYFTCFSTRYECDASEINLAGGTCVKAPVIPGDTCNGYRLMEGVRGPCYSLDQCQAAFADREPPTTPTNLRATALSSSQINLSWTASTDNLGNIHYEIYRNNELKGHTQNQTFYYDTSLASGTGYSYKVYARDEKGNFSSPSASASARTLLYKGTISGAIHSSAGRAITGAYISTTVDGVVKTVRSNIQGEYIIPALNPGSYTVKYQASGYYPKNLQVSVTAGQTTLTNVTLQRFSSPTPTP